MTRCKTLKPSCSPGCLAAVGVCLLAGCFYLPSPPSPIHGKKDLTRSIGSGDSRKPVRVGRSQRDDVVAAFGRPTLQALHDRSIAYRWYAAVGYWVEPLRLFSERDTETYTLVLHFDHADVLTDYRLFRGQDAYAATQGFTADGPVAPSTRRENPGSKP